ncbi:hypothetical protein J2128_001040 [Methanomicrobium sp. W14]|uniref:hypothetical protein n=1 Tax=Methanomicrobium sp. W14 TaxID=2817839 RepID=UPI001AE90BBE|nr:hypothetical protein [Methanomicrobium sp. W14]MBP2133119.1 hypothetical protein [Methanomicrobium sp. W14]
MGEHTKIFTAAMLFLLFFVCPALAYTTEDVTINVNSDGSADITGTYSLNFAEYITFNLIPDKDNLLKNAIEDETCCEISVNSLTDTETSITVLSFAYVFSDNGTYTYKTPEISYDKLSGKIDEILDKYPVLKPFSPDSDLVVPEKTVLSFPDGYSVTYEKPYTGGFVPSVSH